MSRRQAPAALITAELPPDWRAATARLLARADLAERRGVAWCVSDIRDIRLLVAALRLAYGAEFVARGEGP